MYPTRGSRREPRVCTPHRRRAAGAKESPERPPPHPFRPEKTPPYHPEPPRENRPTAQQPAPKRVDKTAPLLSRPEIRSPTDTAMRRHATIAAPTGTALPPGPRSAFRTPAAPLRQTRRFPKSRNPRHPTTRAPLSSPAQSPSMPSDRSAPYGTANRRCMAMRRFTFRPVKATPANAPSKKTSRTGYSEIFRTFAPP